MSTLAMRYGLENPWLDLCGEPLPIEQTIEIAPSPAAPDWDVNAVNHIHELFRRSPRRPIIRQRQTSIWCDEACATRCLCNELDIAALVEAIEPLPIFLADSEERAA